MRDHLFQLLKMAESKFLTAHLLLQATSNVLIKHHFQLKQIVQTPIPAET